MRTKLSAFWASARRLLDLGGQRVGRHRERDEHALGRSFETRQVFAEREGFAPVGSDCFENRVAVEKTAVVDGDGGGLGGGDLAVEKDDAHVGDEAYMPRTGSFAKGPPIEKETRYASPR